MKQVTFIIFIILLTIAAADRTTSAQSTLIFIDSGQVLGSRFSYDVALGDVDGDNDLDAVVANFGLASSGEANAVWLNSGSGVFSDSGQTLGSAASYVVVLGDLDNDQDLDAFVGNFGANAVWLNDGTGTFSHSGQNLGSSSSADVALGDIDGDNDLDAVVANNGNGESNAIWLNQGGLQGGTIGEFAAGPQDLGSTEGWGIALGDLDGDGDLDAVTTRTFGSPRHNNIWWNDGSGSFTEAGQIFGTGETQEVALGDLDGDLDLDIFFANGSSSSSTVWLNRGGAQGGPEGAFISNGQSDLTGSTLDIQLGDLDGDGNLDAFLANYFNGAANGVFLNDGTGQFLPDNQLGSSFSYGAALGDVNGDGFPDAFVANYGGNGIAQGNRVWLNQSSAAPPPIENPEGWRVQRVDSRGIWGTGSLNAIALDSHNRPHLVYLRKLRDGEMNLTEQVVYARWTGVAWKRTVLLSEQVGEDEITVDDLEIVIDGSDNPQVVIVQRVQIPGVPLRLHHFWHDGNRWQQRAPFDLPGPGTPRASYRLELVLDDGENLIVALSKHDKILLATPSGSGWFVLDTTLNVERLLGFAVDDAGLSHFLYHDSADLLYAVQTDAFTWQTEVIDSTFRDDLDGALVLKDDGDPLVAYTTRDDRLTLARRFNQTWQSETLSTSVAISSSGVDLKLDASGNVHLVYAEDHIDDDDRIVYIEQNNGSSEFTWTRTLADVDQVSLAMDGSGRPQLVTAKDNDIFYATIAPRWQHHDVGTTANHLKPALFYGVSNHPQISVINPTSGQLEVYAYRSTGSWLLETSGNGIDGMSDYFRFGDQERLSYRDPVSRGLFLTWNDGNGWQSRLIDATADVGRFQQLLVNPSDPNDVSIIYWDTTNSQIKLARYRIGVDFAPRLFTHSGAPTLDGLSGSLAAVHLHDGDIGVAYYDHPDRALRYAVWEEAAESWTDELLVDQLGSSGPVAFDLKFDFNQGYPVTAYEHPGQDAIVYSYRTTSWQPQPAVSNAGSIDSLALDMRFDSFQYPRLSFIAGPLQTVRAAILHEGTWILEDVGRGASLAPNGLSMTVRDRPTLSYVDAAAGLQYHYRSETINLQWGPDPDAYIPEPEYNVVAICLELFSESGLSARDEQQGQAATTRSLFRFIPNGEVADEEIFAALTDLFAGSQEGQRYIDLYGRHGLELSRIALSDLTLMADTYNVVQDFMPGLEGLVTGRGDQFGISPEMTAAALDIWQRYEQEAGPELAAAINTELAASNDLQDFNGLTFNEWAEAIGVDVPHVVYLPVVQE